MLLGRTFDGYPQFLYLLMVRVKRHSSCSDSSARSTDQWLTGPPVSLTATRIGACLLTDAQFAGGPTGEQLV